MDECFTCVATVSDQDRLYTANNSHSTHTHILPHSTPLLSTPNPNLHRQAKPLKPPPPGLTAGLVKLTELRRLIYSDIYEVQNGDACNQRESELMDESTKKRCYF